VLCLSVACTIAALGAPPAAGAADWPGYLRGPQHASWSPATAITPVNASTLHQVWRWVPPSIAGKPAAKLQASPVVVGARVYIGANTGVFYVLRAGTGSVVWSRQLDVTTKLTCGARGITSTATVAPDPVTGDRTVYVSGARYLYALDAGTGAVRWQTMIGPPGDPMVNDYYNWSSPTVVGAHVYVGISSFCDEPLVRGGVAEIDQHTGDVLATWYSVPDGSIGGSVWTSVAASPTGSDVWVSTGNECNPAFDSCPPGNETGDSLSIVRLSGSLARLDAWQATVAAGGDLDFGSSPTLFGRARGNAEAISVGACNKNGTYYALRMAHLATGPLWSAPIGSQDNASPCLAAALWDKVGRRLVLASNPTTIDGTAYPGSLRRVDPVTGAPIWERGLPCTVTGTPSADAAGVIAAVTRGDCTAPAADALYLVAADNGQVLATVPTSSVAFAQPAFAGTRLFVATETNGLLALAPG
jgi:outer membrane protein assembly factor BamB